MQQLAPGLVAYGTWLAGKFGPPLVEIIDTAGRVSRPHDLRHCVGELAETMLAVAKRHLVPFALTDVAKVHRQTPRRGVGMHVVPTIVRRVKMLECHGDVFGRRAAECMLDFGPQRIGRTRRPSSNRQAWRLRALS